MRRSLISLEEYARLCEQADVSANYHPSFVEYDFTRLGRKPRIVGVYRDSTLVAAFPSMFGQVFPTPLHKRLLGRRLADIGEIGQPETLFPVLPGETNVKLNGLSLTTSALLAGKVRGLRGRSLRAIGIARSRKHHKVTIRQRDFLAAGGRAYFASEMSPQDFADIYVRLHGERWAYRPKR